MALPHVYRGRVDKVWTRGDGETDAPVRSGGTASLSPNSSPLSRT